MQLAGLENFPGNIPVTPDEEAALGDAMAALARSEGNGPKGFRPKAGVQGRSEDVERRRSEVLRLHGLGMTHAEIAAELGLNRGVVGNDISRSDRRHRDDASS